jgi:hypothetical protein
LIVERGSEDLVFAGAAGADHGQGFQGFPAQAGSTNACLSDTMPAGSPSRTSEMPRGTGPRPSSTVRSQIGMGVPAVFVERAGGASGRNATAEIRRHARRGKARVRHDGAEARRGGKEIEEGEAAASAPDHDAAARRVLGRVECQRVRRSLLEDQAE